MRVLIVSPDEPRVAHVMAGLAQIEALEARRATGVAEAAGQLAGFAPDLVVLACDSADRAALATLRAALDTESRAVAMFVDRSGPGLADAAVEAGLAAYVVDGLAPARVGAVAEVAMSRFRAMQRLRAELRKAQADLAARKLIERAKGLLMKARGIDEPTAYGALRKLAMDSGRPLGAVAADLIAYAGVLGADAD